MTPTIDQDFDNFHIGTPIVANTPHPGFMNEPNTPHNDYMGANTPHYIGAMSPGAGDMFGQSPGYMSPSYPGAMGAGMSPGYRLGQSPIYSGQSPIYQATAGGMGMMSPAPHQASQSPSYSPTNSRQSPSYGRNITPAYMNGAASPHYGRATGAGAGLSGTYNPAGSLGAGVSPSYSPTSYRKSPHQFLNSPVEQASPRYSPTTPMTPNYNRPLNQGSQSYSP